MVARTLVTIQLHIGHGMWCGLLPIGEDAIFSVATHHLDRVASVVDEEDDWVHAVSQAGGDLLRRHLRTKQRGERRGKAGKVKETGRGEGGRGPMHCVRCRRPL